jgi:hypothetical protein
LEVEHEETVPLTTFVVKRGSILIFTNLANSPAVSSIRVSFASRRMKSVVDGGLNVLSSSMLGSASTEVKVLVGIAIGRGKSGHPAGGGNSTGQ